MTHKKLTARAQAVKRKKSFRHRYSKSRVPFNPAVFTAFSSQSLIYSSSLNAWQTKRM
jgi:hypothetical protein